MLFQLFHSKIKISTQNHSFDVSITNCRDIIIFTLIRVILVNAFDLKGK